MRSRLAFLSPAPWTAFLVLCGAAATRLAPWTQVFGGERAALIGDTDAWYHVLRAERWLMGAPGAPWRDPWLDWPFGADVPWPPLFDGLLAAAARVVGGAIVERDTLVTVAAFVPVVLGLAAVFLVAALGRRLLGPGNGWGAALVMALVAAAVDPSRLGRPDQHVLEVLLLVAMVLVLSPRLDRGGRGIAGGLVLAILATVAFWSWMGSALHLLVLLAIVAALHALPPRLVPSGARERATVTLAVGGLGAAGLLALTVAWWGSPGSLLSAKTTGVGGLQIALAAATGTFALVLDRLRRLAPDAPAARRAADLAVAAAAPGALLLLLPGLREGIAGGVVALAAGNRWYETISEFQPLLEPRTPLVDHLVVVTRGYGLTLVAAPFAVPYLQRTWRTEPDHRPAVVTLVLLFALFVPAAFLRKRFGVYAIVPLALWAEAGARELARRLAARMPPARAATVARAAVVALLVAVVVPSLPEHGLPDPTLGADKRTLLRWVADQPTPPGREAVLAPWAFGHAIQAFAHRPVIASPFGTEGGDHAMPSLAAVWFATDGARAEALLARRRAGLVLLGLVPAETWTLHAFAPPGTPSPFELVPSRNSAGDMAETLAYWQLVPVRLYHEDGRATDGRSALDGFRLLLETPATSPRNPAMEEQWKLFEPVAGARVIVRGAAGTVSATVLLQANTGRELEWTSVQPAAADGTATLRLPYASGDNGLTRASAWTVTSGGRSLRIVVHEPDVVEGRVLEVDLGAGTVRRGV